VSRFSELLAAEFAPYATLSAEQLEKIEEHYSLLLRWNDKINLTRIESIEDAVRFHYCESLFLANSLPAGPLRIVDVGSGAGFPGIPAAVLRTDCTVDLVESHQRKAVFLRQASSSLANVKVVANRAELCSRDYDRVISRAVRPDHVLSYALAPEATIVLSAGDVSELKEATRLRKLPWGANRFIAEFHVEHGKISD
jgi:16S rRNA (guanine(527)-N(7))-methyltransferase RsmG